MSILGHFHFIRPLWLLALLPLGMLIWLMLTRKLGSRSWENVCDRALLPHILIGTSSKSRRLSVVATLLGGILAILALAGPAWERLPQPVFTPKRALVIALDLTRSMDATDISPSRIARARFKIADILDQRKEGQTALLVYAGDAFTVTPLTDDIATIKSQLTALETTIMPALGNRTDLAITHAEALLKQAGVSKGDILLITDEVNLKAARPVAEAALRKGYRLSILGVGTAHGTPVPLADGSFLKDDKGEIVIPVLKEKPMRTLASLGGGYYHRLTLDDTDIKALHKVLSGVAMDDGFAKTKLQTDVWKEQGPWLLIALLPLVAIIFRRGYLVLLLIFILPFPDTAHAFDWDSLWLNQQMRAKHALDQGDHKRAAELFTRPEWKGPAQYQARDYKGALQSLKGLKDSESIYNEGNALARLGRYEAAIKAYDQVLKLNPKNEDAKYNKKLLEEELKKQKQQQNKNNKNNKSKNQNQKQQQGKNKSASGNSDQQKQNQKQQQQSGNNSRQQTDQGQQPPSRQQQDADKQEQGNRDKNKQQNAEAQDQPRNGNDKKQDQDADKNLSASRERPPDEQEQATEQWLRRIPDDPAGLLRRKFMYQYRQRYERTQPGEKTW
jgi:Ca-activated chloride channel family protein